MSAVIGKISEIFKSIQGEGLHQGISQLFIRFYGCNLNCRFCDTRITLYREVSLPRLMEEVDSYENYHSVSLTGGEPLLQIDFLKDLTKSLKTAGKKIYLETNGILHEALEKVIDYIDIVSMDFKLPSSTNLGPFWVEHEKFLKKAAIREVFVKVVISPNTVLEDIHRSLDVLQSVNRDITLLLQAEDCYESFLSNKLNLIKKICQDKGLNTIIRNQLHKKLGIR